MTSAVLMAGIAGMSSSLEAAKASNPVAKLLVDARASSSQVAADWKAYARQPNLNWSGDGPEIARMKDDIGVAVKTVTMLLDLRAQGSSSQIDTIDQVVPVMEELVDNAKDAITYLNANQSRLTTKECRENLEANSDTSNRLAGLIAELVELGSGRDKFEAAKRTLELSLR